MTTTPETPAILRSDDLIQHICDTPFFLLFRTGRSVRLTWNELTEIEQQQQREAADRAFSCDVNCIYE